MKPCTNRTFPNRDYAGRVNISVACESCGHTSLVHPGPDNKVGACVLCELVMLLPPRQDPQPLTPTDQPPVLVHIAMDVSAGRMRPYVEEPAAIALAREHQGVVVSMPVSSDWRAITDE